MSCSETEKSENGNQMKKYRLTLHKMKEVKKMENKEIYAYIERLHEFLKKNEQKLKKYKEHIKRLIRELDELRHKDDKNAAAEEVDTVKIKETNEPKEKQNTEDAAASDAFNFVAEIRQAAEQAQHLNGFVYEPTSGLYYDQKTGYYYNAEYGLYYDGSNGCYYNYNQEKNSFEFHSQVAVQPNQNAMQGKNVDNDDDDNDNDDVDVAFDEWGGVITDKQRLQQIKAEKEEQKLKEKNKRRKTGKPAGKSNSSAKHKEKKRKRAKSSKREAKSQSNDSAEDSENGSETETRRSRKRQRAAKDIEDGEISSSSSSRSSDSESSSRDEAAAEGKAKSKVQVFKRGSRFQDLAKKYPPSLRVIVQETNLEQLKVGSLSLITFKGGSLGREGKHDVIVPDVNVSKFHLKFHYDNKKGIYKCIDLGSRNGTILNGVRMSTSQMESEAHDLVHGSVLQIAQTKLLCHMHEGNSTCGLCEPGLLIEPPREIATAAAGSGTVTLSHKEQLKKLQKKYGLENEKFLDGKQTGCNYNDRAATRRIQVGSTTDKEKTQIASVNTEISSENKGFKMLSKLGWQKGDALGKTNASGGLLEPINVTTNEGKKGLGCEESTSSIGLSQSEKKKIDTWKKAQQRYQKTNNIFSVSDDDSN